MFSKVSDTNFMSFPLMSNICAELIILSDKIQIYSLAGFGKISKLVLSSESIPCWEECKKVILTISESVHVFMLT